MQLRIAVNTSQLAGLPASTLPAFELPQLCWPAGHVGPQLALLKARLEPKLSKSAAKARLYTLGR